MKWALLIFLYSDIHSVKEIKFQDEVSCEQAKTEVLLVLSKVYSRNYRNAICVQKK